MPAALRAYSQWKQEAAVRKARAASNAATDDSWREYARFSSSSGASRFLDRRIVARDLQPVAGFRERIEYSDGFSFVASSTGGRSVETVDEQRLSAEGWWRYSLAPERVELEVNATSLERRGHLRPQAKEQGVVLHAAKSGRRIDVACRNPQPEERSCVQAKFRRAAKKDKVGVRERTGHYSRRLRSKK